MITCLPLSASVPAISIRSAPMKFASSTPTTSVRQSIRCSMSLVDSSGSDFIRRSPWETISEAEYRLSIAGLNTCTRFLAIIARRRRRIRSSLFPENIGPQMTSIQPRFPVTISMLPGEVERLAARRNRDGRVVALLDQLRQRLLGRQLAMHEEYALQSRRDRRHP